MLQVFSANATGINPSKNKSLTSVNFSGIKCLYGYELVYMKEGAIEGETDSPRGIIFYNNSTITQLTTAGSL